MYKGVHVLEILCLLLVFNEPPSLYTRAADSIDITVGDVSNATGTSLEPTTPILTKTTEGKPMTPRQTTPTTLEPTTPTLTKTTEGKPMTPRQTTPTTAEPKFTTSSQPPSITKPNSVPPKTARPTPIATSPKTTKCELEINSRTEESSPRGNGTDKSGPRKTSEEWIMWLIVEVAVVYTALVVTVVALKVFASRTWRKRDLEGKPKRNEEAMKSKSVSESTSQDEKGIEEEQVNSKDETKNANESKEATVNVEEAMTNASSPGTTVADGSATNEPNTQLLVVNNSERKDGTEIKTNQAEIEINKQSENSEGATATLATVDESKNSENQAWSTTLLGNVDFFQDKDTDEKALEGTDTTLPPPPSPADFVPNATVESELLAPPSAQVEEKMPSTTLNISPNQDVESATRSTDL